MQSLVEYIWLDINGMTRSKVRIMKLHKVPSLSEFEHWQYDGYHTGQAHGSRMHTDVLLIPIAYWESPLPLQSTSNRPYFLVLCDIGKPHGTKMTSRQYLLETLRNVSKGLKPMIGFEQEYTLLDARSGMPLDLLCPWIKAGSYYCGNGNCSSFDIHDFLQKHATWCLDMGLRFAGYNLGVSAGQFAFQIGSGNNVVEICDHLIMARFLLGRCCEKFGFLLCLHPKPFPDITGCGCNTLFSTTFIRSSDEDFPRIIDQIGKPIKGSIHAFLCELARLEKNTLHIYGKDNFKRLEDDHNPNHIDKPKETKTKTEEHTGIIRPVVYDRKPTVRICDGQEYIEDSRPGANCDPYLVAQYLIDVASGSQ